MKDRLDSRVRGIIEDSGQWGVGLVIVLLIFAAFWLVPDLF
jgi:hypothetical protein